MCSLSKRWIDSKKRKDLQLCGISRDTISGSFPVIAANDCEDFIDEIRKIDGPNYPRKMLYNIGQTIQMMLADQAILTNIFEHDSYREFKLV